MAVQESWDDYADIARWERNHKDPAMQEKLIGSIKRSWKRSLTYNIDYQRAKPVPVGKLTENRSMKASKKLRIYSKSVIDTLIRQNRARDLGIALFSPDGLLLFLVGDEEIMLWANQNGLQSGTRWTEESIGTNIFSVGIARTEATILMGHENFSRCMVGANYYFTPILLSSGECLGGVAILVRADKHNEFMVGNVVTLARAIELQFFWLGMFQIYSDISEGSGTLVVDQIHKKNRISLISDEIFRILGIPPREIYEDDLENLVDRSPANQAFWDIVESGVETPDATVNIVLNRKSVVVNISSSPFHEERFNMVGVVLNISSIKRINKLVSQYSGNNAHFSFDNVVGNSDPMRFVINRSKIAARSNGSILLLGESGVGKDVLAQAIHSDSNRKDRSFVALNCGAFSKELISSELFGYEDGAFTGAKKGGSIGKFELANGGTLFLDEIADMPADLQAVLLRVLEERAFRKVGGNAIIPTDVRVIAATNKNLDEEIEHGRFRQDLFYRLGVIRIRIPPLRERRDDILLFVDHYLHVICGRVGKPLFSLTEAAKNMLYDYHWPGNVRELQNLLEGIISTQESLIIDVHNIKDYLGPAAPPQMSESMPWPSGEQDEQRDIERALRMFRNNRSRAAVHLGMSRSTLYRHMREFGMLDD